MFVILEILFASRAVWKIGEYISPGSLSVLITSTKTNHKRIAAQVFVHVASFGSNSNSKWRSTGAAIKGVTIFTSPSSYIDLILCLLHNRLLDYGIETDLWKKTVFVQK